MNVIHVHLANLLRPHRISDCFFRCVDRKRDTKSSALYQLCSNEVILPALR
jgi:hypothetical protein